MSDTVASKPFVISRVFDAPRDLVWKAFTEPERMKQWWGPKGVKVVASKMDLRPGGIYHYGMQVPDGSVMWGKLTLPRDQGAGAAGVHHLVLRRGRRHHAASAIPTWPLEMFSIFTFEEQPGGKTKLTVNWSPHNASDEERKTFDTSHDSMTKGWGGTLEQLEAYLGKAKA